MQVVSWSMPLVLSAVVQAQQTPPERVSDAVPASVSVSVSDDGALRIGDRPVDRGELGAGLTRALERSRRREVRVTLARDVSARDGAVVVTAALTAGAEHLRLDWPNPAPGPDARETRRPSTVLALDSEGRIVYGGRILDPSVLEALLPKVLGTERGVHLSAAAEAAPGLAAQLVFPLREAGCRTITIARPDLPVPLRELDAPPRPLHRREPELTAKLRAKLPAQVTVVFVVEKDGTVALPKVHSSTDPAFEAAALAAVRAWRFEPGTRDGEPCRFRQRVPFQFGPR